MLTPLRREVQASLAELPVRRKPALRRSDAPDALLATDLPLVAEEAVAARWAVSLTEKGWRVRRSGDWLLLDRDVPAPEPARTILSGDEIGCCLSLLTRHPGEAPVCDIRALVKAADAGRPSLERLCARWHQAWAAALREGRPLPGGLLPYVSQANNDTLPTEKKEEG